MAETDTALTVGSTDQTIVAFQQNQRSEIIDLGDNSAALQASRSQQDTFLAFSPFGHYRYEQADEAATIHNPRQFSGSENYIVENPPQVFGGNNRSGEIDVFPALNAHPSGRQDFSTEALIFEPRVGRNGRGMPSSTSPTVHPRSGSGDTASMVMLDSDRLKFGVRRLTPVECERLQGFPDMWTAYGIKDAGSHPAKQTDASRYRQLGNAVAVPVVAWIAKRLVQVEHNDYTGSASTNTRLAG